jgi:cobalt/nickel transport protein
MDFKLNKNRLLLALLVLCLLTPAGIFLPRLFHAGDAWGEWDKEQVKKEIGYEPQGMKKNAGLWKAPLPDYRVGKDNSLFSDTIYYLLSGITGMGIIAISTWLLFKYYKRNG